MKKTLAAILSAVMLSASLCSCGSSDLFGQTEPEKEEAPEARDDIDIEEDDPVPPEGPLYFSAPEKTADKDITQLTISSAVVKMKGSGSIYTNITSGFDKEGGRTRYYRKTAINGIASDAELCDISIFKGSTKYYVQTEDGYTERNLPVSAGYSASAYFEGDYAVYGINYEDRFKDARFLKLDDSVCFGKECYVYEMTAKDTELDKEVTMEIYVDKDSGLWVHSFSEDYIMTVTSFVFDAHGVPGVTPVNVAGNGVMYNACGIRIIAEDMLFDDPNYAVVMKLRLENNNNVPVKVTSGSFSVNGMCLGGSVISKGCSAKGSADITVEIPNTALEICGTDIIRDVSARLRIVQAVERDTQSGTKWYEEIGSTFGEDQYAIFTTDCGDHAAKKNKNSPDGKELIATGEFTMKHISTKPSDNGGAYITLYAENTSGRDNIRAKVTVGAVNGKKIDLYDNIIVYKGTKNCSRIYISAGKLDELGLNAYDITDISLNIDVYRGESLSGTDKIGGRQGIGLQIYG